MLRAAVCVACVVASPAFVHAQAASDAFGIERFRPAMDADGMLDVEAATVPAHLAWSGGVFIGFAHDPLVVYDSDMSPVESLVDRRLTTGVIGALGLWNRAELGVALDIVGYQHGSDTSPTMKDLPAGGLGDVRVAFKVLAVATPRVQLAVIPALAIPAGSASGYLREAGVAFEPAVAVSGGHGRVRGAINLGYRVRERVEVAGLVSDDEAFVRAALGVQLDVAELSASTSLAAPVTDRSANQVAIEALAGAARPITDTLAAFVGGGIGLDNGFGVPDWRAFGGVRVIYGRDVPKPPPIVVETPPVVVERPTTPPPPPPAKLAGHVVDREGRPIRHATVSVAGTQAITDDNGAFAIAYPGGPVEVGVQADDYQPATTPANAAPGQTAEVSIVLARAVRQGQLRGQVMSFAGKPLAATIQIAGAATASTQADADGQFAVDLPEGTFEVTIEAPGFTTQKRTIKVKLDGVTVLNVDLRGTK